MARVGNELPNQDGKAGKYLKTDGFETSWEDGGGGGGGGGGGDMEASVYDPANGAKQVAFGDEVVKLDQTTPQTIINGNLSVDEPLDQENIATKGYVDKTVSDLNIFFFLTDSASGVGTYKEANFTDGGPEATIDKNSLNDDDLLFSWISTVSETPTKIPYGLLDAHAVMSKIGGTKKLSFYAKFYEYKTDTTETLIATSNGSQEITTKGNYQAIATLLSDYIISAGSRIVCKFYASVKSTGTDPSIRIFYEGNNGSHFGIPTDVEVLANNFLKLDGSNANQNVNLGTFDIEANNLSGTNTGDQEGDGTTITGTGTSIDPFVAVSGGSGDVAGPAVSVDNDIVLFDGAGGKKIKDSGKKLSDYQVVGTYSTDIHSNITALDNVSGVNTGDQDLSGKQDALAFTPEDVSNKQTNLTASATKYPTVNAVNTGLSGKQNSLGYTAENNANKKTSLADNSDTFYPTQKAVKTAVDAKQATLVSGTNIKTVNGTTLLGSGNIATPNTTYTASDFDIKDLTDSTSLKTTWNNKADKPNSQTITSATSITPTGNYEENEYYVTALVAGLTINAPSGTAENGNTIFFRFYSAADRALTWNAAYDWICDKPTTTKAGKVVYVGGFYNSTSSKWEITSINEKE